MSSRRYSTNASSDTNPTNPEGLSQEFPKLAAGWNKSDRARSLREYQPQSRGIASNI
jgi:hypothetical protein